MNLHLKLISFLFVFFLLLTQSAYTQQKVIDSVSYEILPTKVVVNVELKVSSNEAGIPDADIQSLILCGNDKPSGPYKKQDGVQNGNSQQFTIPVTDDAPAYFFLKNDWEKFFFHLGISPNGKCNNLTRKEPAFDMQIARSKPVTPETKFTVGKLFWVADKNGGVYDTKFLTLHVTPTACAKFSLLVKEKDGGTVYATSKEIVACDDTEIELQPNPGNKLVPNKDYDIFIGEKNIGKINSGNNFDSYYFSSIMLTDGPDSVDLTAKNVAYIANTNTPKDLSITTKNDGLLEIEPLDSCIITTRQTNDPASNMRFQVKLNGCPKGIVSFRLKGTGENNQPLPNENKSRIFSFNIDNETRFTSPISFVPDSGKTTFKYKLSRKVENHVTASVNGTGLALDATATGPDVEGFYSADIPNSIVDAIRNQASKDLIDGKKVDVIFSFIDKTPGAVNAGVIDSLKISAFAVNPKLLKEVAEGPKLGESQAKTKAMELLNLNTADLAKPDEKAAFDYVFNLLKDDNKDKRSKAKSILFFVGKIGLGLLGIPIPTL